MTDPQTIAPATRWAGLGKRFGWHSLRTKITFITLAVFLVGLWSVTIFAVATLRADMGRLLGEHQFATASILAAEIGREIDNRFRALEAVAANLGQLSPARPADVKQLLEQRPVLHVLFNGGIVVRARDGTTLAAIAPAATRLASAATGGEAAAATLASGTKAIGPPVMEGDRREAAFGISVPIRDATGRVAGAIEGLTRLDRPNFLDKITEGRYGEAGINMVVDRQRRMVVTATDRRMQAMALPPPGRNALIDRFIGGYEGSGVAVNPLGVEVLGSASGIPAAGWYLAMALPTAEAFAPGRAMQRRVLLATLALTLLVGIAAWWAIKRQLSPLFSTAERLAQLSDETRARPALPTTGQQETDRLVDGVNHLLDALARKEADLRESEARYRSLFEMLPDAVFVHRNDILVFANEATARLFHAPSARALIGRDWHALVPPEHWPVSEERVALLVSGRFSALPPLERRHIGADGQPLILEMMAIRVTFDGEPAVLSVLRDITDRRQSEEQRLVEARRQRDTLIREVHHRIKNNLQSVAGLLQRELGRFTEQNPRLETAISQVNAIAAVHGLQAAESNELITLCDNVSRICASVADMMRRPVHIDITERTAACCPVHVETSDAVSVALVINELILNAVKHSPPQAPPPAVAVEFEGDKARVTVRNAISATPGFDLVRGTGLGTGLRLVRSLLPEQGARLASGIDGEGWLWIRLELEPPVLAAEQHQEVH